MVWQVPQRRDHVTEHLSLADDIKEDSELAEVNSKIYNDLYSRGLSTVCLHSMYTKKKNAI